MANAIIDRLVDSVLYEGYLLYPYRSSLKNNKLWIMGGIYPEWAVQVRSSGERCRTRAQVLCSMFGRESQLHIELRFLHMIDRCTQSTTGQMIQRWYEGRERRIPLTLAIAAGRESVDQGESFEFPIAEWSEQDSTASNSGGTIIRRQEQVAGQLDVVAKMVAPQLYRLTISILNRSPQPEIDPIPATEETATGALRSLASANVVLRLDGGEFISRIDPPAEHKDLVTPSDDDGLWPVLVGADDKRDTMLCSPIILYDHPEIAPESPGDFFDATEIDEMLTLRILTLTDEEKEEVARFDDRGRALLERTHRQAKMGLPSLHGTIRSKRTAVQEGEDDGLAR